MWLFNFEFLFSNAAMMLSEKKVDKKEVFSIICQKVTARCRSLKAAFAAYSTECRWKKNDQ